MKKQLFQRKEGGGYKDYWMASDVLEFTSHGYNGYVFDKNNEKVEFIGYRADCINNYALDYIRNKDQDLTGQMVSQGTTPRHLTDLIGSLCELTSGSGDKGTPIVLVQGYFDNYTK